MVGACPALCSVICALSLQSDLSLALSTYEDAGCLLFAWSREGHMRGEVALILTWLQRVVVWDPRPGGPGGGTLPKGQPCSEPGSCEPQTPQGGRQPEKRFLYRTLGLSPELHTDWSRSPSLIFPEGRSHPGSLVGTRRLPDQVLVTVGRTFLPSLVQKRLKELGVWRFGPRAPWLWGEAPCARLSRRGCVFLMLMSILRWRPLRLP